MNPFNQSSPHEKMSQKYEFVQTFILLSKLYQTAGWKPHQTSIAQTRSVGNEGYQKHLVRLRQEGEGGMLPNGDKIELILINSHNGASSLRLMMGVFRMACANGLIFGEEMMDEIRIRHIGYTHEKLEKGLMEVDLQRNKLVASVERMQAKVLVGTERLKIAEAGLDLRWGEQHPPGIYPSALLSVRRDEDRKDNAWTIMNKVQENIIKGVDYYSPQEGKYRRTRALKSIDAQTKLNKGLWEFTGEMLKAA